jgi:hypothetical protein
MRKPMMAERLNVALRSAAVILASDMQTILIKIYWMARL